MPEYDVITLGETMIRLTPPQLQRFEQATTFQIFIGGSESNTAIGLSRLGLNVCWLSRLTDNALGRTIAGEIQRYGVDTSHIVWTQEGRVGVYFVEEGKRPRGSRVIYDRAASAMSKMQPSDLPKEFFQKNQARLLHLTGITLAIGEKASQTAQQALNLAKEAGWLVSFDVNYRSKLWTPEEAVKSCEVFMQAVDIIFIPFGDAKRLYQADDDPQEALRQLRIQYPHATIVMTLGANGAIGGGPEGGIHHQAVFPAEEVGRVGGGDAFSAGFLYGYLTAQDASERLPFALKWGAATAALKYTIPGDVPLVDFEEVQALVRNDSTSSLVR